MACSVTYVLLKTRFARAWNCKHSLALFLKTWDKSTLLGIQMHLGIVNMKRRSNCLAVWFEDPASLCAVLHQGNVLFGSLTTLSTICGRSAPKHHFRVLCVCGDVGNVRSSTRLKVAVDTFLKVGRVISISMARGRLVLPEQPGLLGSICIVLKWILTLDKRAYTSLSKLLLYFNFLLSFIWFDLISSHSQNFSLCMPFMRRSYMLFHGMGESFC